VSEPFLHVPPGVRIGFSRFPDFDGPWQQTVVDDAVAVAEALWPDVRPLAVDLWVATRSLELPFVRGDVEPARKGWHLEEEHVPEGVEVASYSGPEVEASTTPELTPDALRKWIGRALDQEPPEPAMVVTLGGIVCRTLRARVLDTAWVRDGVVSVRDGSAQYDVPLEHREDGLWVVAPLAGSRVEPPVTYELELDDAVAFARVAVLWSQWSQRGSAEHDALERSLAQIVAQGWTADAVEDTFDLGAPSENPS
jgi:hypothetical protein